MALIRRMREAVAGSLGLACAVIALCGPAPSASAQNSDIAIQDITRLEGYGSDRLWGMGLVFGLPATGDSAKVTPKARQLAVLMEHAGNPIAGLEEALAAKGVAIVMVTARLPETGVLTGDEYHLDVQTMFDAKSLEGGNLFLTPMRGSNPGNPYIYAYGAGKITFDGPITTSGRVSHGCRIIRDLRKSVVSEYGTVTFQIRENYASNGTATLIANLINQDRQGLRAEGAPPIARARDERSVVVSIPDEELSNPVRFIADLQKIVFDQSLLRMRPRIVINEAAGLIVITGNVVIKPTVIASGGLVVTTTEPEIPATLENPLITQSNSTLVSTGGDPASVAQAQALLEAMRRMEVPVEEQIQMFRALAESRALSVPVEFQ